MRFSPRLRRLRRLQRRSGERAREAGDTLIEVLVTVAIVGLGAVAIIGGLAAAISTSGTHRNVTTLDTIVRSFAETARDEIQLKPSSPSGNSGPLFTRCAPSYALASTPYPSSGPDGTPVTVFVTGLGAGATISATVDGVTVPSITSPASGTTSGSGSATVGFVVPSGVASGPQIVSISAGGTSATTTFTVAPTAPPGSTGAPLSDYSLTVPSVQYWNGSQFGSSCNADSANSDLQELTISATAPDASDGVNVVVSNPSYVPTPTVTVASSPTNPSVGNALTFTATVTPPPSGPAPTGTVTWVIDLEQGGQQVGAPNCTTTSGLTLDGVNPYEETATCRISGAPAGTYTATAEYGGDSHYNAAQGTGSPLTVAQVTPTVSVVGSPTDPTYGSTLTFTATVQPAPNGPTPTGTITWTITSPAGTSPTCAPTTLSGTGISSCNVANAVVGSYSVTAVYSGDVNYSAATGTSGTITVPQITPTVTVVGTPASPTYGSTLTFTATVNSAGGGPNPTGTVTWTFPTKPSGSSPTCATSTLDGSGTATCTVASGVVGRYAAKAAYSGDSTYVAASATSNTLTVPKITPTVTVTSNPANPTTGSTVTFTGVVAGGVAGGPTLSGTLAWTGVNCNSTTYSISGTTATGTCVVNSATAGSYTATATYSGDVNYSNASGSNNPVTVSPATPTVTVTATPASPTYGSTLTFTAAVAGPAGAVTPTGTVTWSITAPSGTSPTCSNSTLTGGTATCTIANAIPGTYGVTAGYGGDSNYTSASGSTSKAVSKVAPTVTVAGTPANPTYGSTLTFTATVNPAGGAPTPTGTVTWTFTGTGTASCSQSTLNGSGVATCSVPSATPGTYTAVASYSGDSNYSAQSGTSNTLTVPLLTPAVSVAGSPDNPAYGSTIVFTATIAGLAGNPTPTGTVSWTLTGTSAACTRSTLSASGTATCSLANSTPGTYTAKATYSGDSNYSGGSGSGSLTEQALSDTVTVAQAPTSPTYGNSVTFTATVTGQSGGPALSGSVTWTITPGNNVAPGAPASCTSTTPLAVTGTTGTASCTMSAPWPGGYTVAANYQNDPNYSTMSGTDNLSIPKVTPTVSVSSGSGVSNGSVTFAATVNGATGPATPTGSITWTVNGSATTCAAGTLNSSGSATCKLTSMTKGNYAVSASYSGDDNYNSASGTLGPPSNYATLGLSSQANGNGSNENLTVTATLTTSGGLAPTGSMVWTVTGNATSCTGGTTPMAGTSPTYTWTCIIDGSHNKNYTVTAAYGGDPYYLPVSLSATESG